MNAEYFAHESALIDDGAQIGDGTKIWHFTHVCSGAEIGEHCTLGQGNYVASTVRIGNGVKIQNNVSLFDGVVLEDDVFCGPSMVFTNVITPRAFINRRSEFKQTLVRQGASIGANATIVCGVQIGCFSMVAAGAVVTSDVPDFALIVGVPGKQIGWVSETGASLRLPVEGNGEGICPETGTVYQLVDGVLVKGETA